MWYLWPVKLGLVSTVLFTVAFGLPYVPFLSGAFVRAATGAAPPGSPEKASVILSEGVRDRELDG
jgi:hypothetical protein